MKEILEKLLQMSHELGREELHLTILGEGNTSARVSKEQFYVKASGSTLGTLSEKDVTLCDTKKVLDLLELESPSDTAVDETLLAARVDEKARKPSVEALFHAWLLTLPEVNFVGHTHSIAVNAILCSPRAREFAEKRLFPDEVVCCGSKSVYVPYTDPGLALARAIRHAVREYQTVYDFAPRVILLENHGIITIGPTPEAVIAAMRMADKAARIFLGAAQVQGPRFLSAEQVKRIAGRQDEKYRQQALGI